MDPEPRRPPEHVRAQYEDAAFYAHRDVFLEHLLAHVRRCVTGPGRPCLDIGCNTGRYTQRLNDLGFAATGLEIDPERIRDARRDYPGVTFQEGDAHALPYPPCAFEAVTLLGPLQCLPDWRTAMREAFRVLKPGGIALIETNRAFGVPELLLRLLLYTGARRMSFREAAGFWAAHRGSARQDWSGGFRKFRVGDLVSAAREAGAVGLEIHDPLRHGLFHDFIFAVTAVKGEGGGETGARGTEKGERARLKICDECRRGIQVTEA